MIELIGPIGAEVVVTIKDSSNSEKELTYLSIGNYFGEKALLHGGHFRRTATVRARTNVRLLVVEKDSFDHWMDFRLYVLLKDVPLLAEVYV